MSSTLDHLHTSGTPHGFAPATVADLTGREREILELITNGYSNVEISRMLYLSLNTVKTYVRTCYRKIGAETRSHAVVWGARHGLLVGVPATVGSELRRPV